MKQSKVIFNKENHTYKLGDVFLQGVTGILSRRLFQDKYDNVPDFVLERAASRGTFIHECCELVDTLGIIPDNTEAQNYIALKKVNGLEAISNEYIVSDNKHYASAIDVVFSDYSLGDIKTTYKFDNEYVSWQLSIYAYLFELQNKGLKANKLYGIWLRGDVAELIEVERKPIKVIKELLKCDLEDRDFVNPYELVIPEDVYLVQDDLIELDRQEKEIKEKKEKILSKLLDDMEKSNIDKWETEKIRLTRRKPTVSERFDSRSFKEFNPDLYGQFIRKSEVKGSIILKVV